MTTGKARLTSCLLSLHPHTLTAQVSLTHDKPQSGKGESHLTREKQKRFILESVACFQCPHQRMNNATSPRQTESRTLSDSGCLLLYRLIVNDILSLIQ